MSENTSKANDKENIHVNQCAVGVPETKEDFCDWLKDHKKQLLLAGVSITAVIILGIKNKDTLAELRTSLPASIKKVAATTSGYVPVVQAVASTPEMIATRPYTWKKNAFDVSGHIRTMAKGRHHSAEKAVEAASLCVELLPNQTLVSPYRKCVA